MLVSPGRTRPVASTDTPVVRPRQPPNTVQPPIRVCSRLRRVGCSRRAKARPVEASSPRFVEPDLCLFSFKFGPSSSHLWRTRINNALRGWRTLCRKKKKSALKSCSRYLWCLFFLVNSVGFHQKRCFFSVFARCPLLWLNFFSSSHLLFDALMEFLATNFGKAN